MGEIFYGSKPRPVWPQARWDPLPVRSKSNINSLTPAPMPRPRVDPTQLHALVPVVPDEKTFVAPREEQEEP